MATYTYTYCTGSLTRSHKYRNHGVYGDVELCGFPPETTYNIYVYNSEIETIWEYTGTIPNPSKIINILYKIPKNEKTWIVSVETTNMGYVNIYHSIKNKHRSELCFKTYDLINSSLLIDILPIGGTG